LPEARQNATKLKMGQSRARDLERHQEHHPPVESIFRPLRESYDEIDNGSSSGRSIILKAVPLR